MTRTTFNLAQHLNGRNGFVLFFFWGGVGVAMGQSEWHIEKKI
jgi:hypothetical protein